jgi:hypothetical protein
MPRLSSGAKIGLASLAAAAMWLYVARVLIVHQRADAVTLHVPRGNLSDLYPRWLGSRELLLHHRDPYSPEVTREIQAGYYGRPLDPSHPEDPKDRQAFAYPVYVAFLLAPTIALPFGPLRTGFELFLILATAASVWFWMRTIRWKTGSGVWIVAVFLVLGSFSAVQGIKLDQLTLLVAAFVSLAAFLLARGSLLASGIVMAVATIKPQLALPLSGCLVLWALSDWRRRQAFIWGFVSALGILVLAGQFVLPGWLPKFWIAIHEYVAYTGGVSLLDRLVPFGLGSVVSAALMMGLVVLVWRWRAEEPGSHEFSRLLAAILAATLLVVPTFAPYNQLLLVPALLMTARDSHAMWGAGALRKAMLLATALTVGWPWIAASALVVASFGPHPEAAQRAWAAPLYTVLVIPFVVFFDLALLREDDDIKESSASAAACNA